MSGINFIREIARLYIWARPSDPQDLAGYGPFTIPSEHPLSRVGPIHDYYFTYAKRCKEANQKLDGETLNEADIKLFRMMVFIAMNQPTERGKLEIMMDVCLFWPVARDIGEFIWKGPKEPET